MTLDYRAHIMNLIKTIPLDLIITYIYPKLYTVHNLTEKVSHNCVGVCVTYIVGQDLKETKERQFAKLPVVQLNSQFLTRQGIYIMDAGLVSHCILYTIQYCKSAMLLLLTRVQLCKLE